MVLDGVVAGIRLLILSDFETWSMERALGYRLSVVAKLARRENLLSGCDFGCEP
jgi:hypothetical protein